MKRLAREWASYRERIVPAQADEVQVQQCRRAFYAGAVAVWAAVLALAGPETGPDPTEAELASMDALQAELDTFGRDVAEGRA